MKSLLVLTTILLLGTGCSSFKAQRVDRNEGDEKALSITDKWVQRDTEDAVKDLVKQMEKHPSFQEVLKNSKKKLKIFIAEVQNETSEPYFPIRDINDELLNEFSYSGKFTLVDAEAREKLLKEIQYQNDGMVDSNQAKSIGKQFGADVLVLGSVRMQPESRDGKTIKQYSVNLRMTNLETAEEVLRIRFKTSKYSEQSKTGW
jgi:uncharacterized protein (TIGR02722 family)